MRLTTITLGILLLAAGWLAGQSRSFVGTVTGIKAETAEIEVKPDKAPPVVAKFTPDSIAERVAPGETDLKKATHIQVTEVATGDRVLVTLEAGASNVRRIIVMSANDIARRNEADRLDWQKRGVTGIVASKSATQITLKMRSITGESQAVVTVSPQTSFKRYAPDSVKFADARLSKLEEVSVGDQLRARGQKSEDGLKVTADEVVFGTFLAKGGTVSTVNPEAKEITIKELGTGKTLTVRLTADSQLKRMPDFGAMMAGGRPGGGPPSGGAPAGGRPGMSGPPAGMPGRSGGMDLSQMLERMPASNLESIKAGETIVVSSTKGAKEDELTAIMILSNADFLIRMASASSAGRSGAGSGSGGMSGSMGMGGMGMGGGGLDLGSMGLGGIMQ